ncbi:MAG: hypothetical protein WBE26_09350 [Phycisphaerae bacterium]
MRSERLLLIARAVAFGCVAAIVSAAAEPGDNRARTIVTETPATELDQAAADPGKIPGVLLSPLRTNAEIRRHTVSPGGAEVRAAGFSLRGVPQHVVGPGGTGVGTKATDTGRLVYSNTLGQQVVGLSWSTYYNMMADDIATTAVDGCALDRYTTIVTGDRRGDGSGEGPYSVDIGLYETCPGAADYPNVPIPIPNTDCHFEFDDNAVYAVTCSVPSHIDVPLPSNFYLGVQFSRGECGVVIGAPATLGFSADLYDYPGLPCYAWAGGYPDHPHASFHAEIYVRDECENAFVGYKNSNQAGTAYAPGYGVPFADDIHLGVSECNLIAYEVAVKGFGLFEFDLRTSLSNDDPENGGVIAGTRGTALSLDDHVKIERVEIDPPVSLPLELWITFKSTSSVAGPIITNREASLGSTEDLYRLFDGSRWVTEDFGDYIYAAFDVTIWCDGEPPVGACCDTVLTENRVCIGGSNDGHSCVSDFHCPDGECVGDAVCRQLAKMNCGSPEPQFWREGKSCESVCEGGYHDGESCTRQADCPGYSCPGGPDEGLPCDPDDPDDCPQSFCKRAKCPGPFPHPCGQSACCTHDDWCFNYTENECYAREPVDKPRLFARGEYCYEGGFSCPWGACLAKEGECSLPHPEPGCEDPWCCVAVCDCDYHCCLVEWDEQCVSNTFWLCRGPPANDECWDPEPEKGARLVTIPSSTESDSLHATEDPTDPGFCCHGGVDCPGGMCCYEDNEECYSNQYGLCVDGERDGKPCDPEPPSPLPGPGSQGYGTVWYKFVTPDTSVELLTCNSSNVPRINDSVISLYALADPDWGICENMDPCSIANPDCGDGSECVLDEQYACEHLLLIGCSDDVEYCSSNDANAHLCVTNLEIGQTYYVLVGTKIDLLPNSLYYDRVAFNLEIYEDCTRQPPIPNDFCQNATPLAGDDLDVPFDLSGGEEYAPATFHCPGEPGSPMLQNDTWYTWTAPCSGYTTITTCDEGLPPLDQPNTTLCVYDGCNCPPESGTLIGECNFGTFDECGPSATVKYDAIGGNCYTLRLGGYMGGTPAGVMRIDIDCPVVFVNPLDGVIDARRPYPPHDPNDREGIDKVVIQGPAGLDNTDHWSLYETVIDGTENLIDSVVDNGDGTFTVHLDRSISTGAVTTITHDDGSGTVYTGVFTSHPANANYDGMSDAADVLAIIDYINGVDAPPWDIQYSADCDHSGVVGPADILCVIDLLNGADEFEPWLGVPLSASR